ncbi:MAG: ferric reductase-like transmembrane domain-containing protein [Cyanobacteria bacterium P01_D01_bin.1]
MDNTLGLFAMLTYVATLVPSNFKVVFPAFRYTSFYRLLLKNRRSIGLWTFGLSVAHACVILYQQHSSLSEMEFYRKSISGFLLLFIFMLLAVTSNNWSIRKLRKNWKRLHSLTYVAACLIPWHISVKMADKWSIVTVVCMTLAVNIIFLWTFRRYREIAQSKQHQENITILMLYLRLRLLLMRNKTENLVDYQSSDCSNLSSKRSV